MGVGRLILNALWWSSFRVSCPSNILIVYPIVRATKESRHNPVFPINNQDVIHSLSIKEGYFRKKETIKMERKVISQKSGRDVCLPLCITPVKVFVSCTCLVLPHLSLFLSLSLSSQVNGEMRRQFGPVPLGCRCMLIPNPPVALRRSRTGVAYEVAYTRAGNVITDRLGSEDLVVAVPIEAAVPV
jgi:hypothetical protein